MKITINQIFQALMIFIISLVTSGCSQDVIPGNTIQPYSNAERTLTSTPTPMLTSAITDQTPPSVSIKNTDTPIPTTTSTPNPTYTAIPTIAKEDLPEKLKTLLQSNGDCVLPCWIGIIPGKTRWEEAKPYLESLEAEIIDLQESQNFSWGVTIYGSEDATLKRIGASINVEEGVVKIIRTGFYFPLADLFQGYGQPDEIWVFSDNKSINPEAPFTIALFYEQLGFLAVYEGTSEKGETINICPNRIIEAQSLWLFWDPSLDITFEKAGSTILLFAATPAERPFYPLDEVANLIVDDFYQTYRQGQNSSNCFVLDNK